MYQQEAEGKRDIKARTNPKKRLMEILQDLRDG
jgi:hypothetical protein